MALPAKKHIFGIHSFTAYNILTGMPYGTAHVNGEMTFALSGEQIDLFGGSSLYAWANENGVISAEGSISFRELPDWTYGAFQGVDATTNAAETGGFASTIAAVSGSSVVATTGIATVGVKSGSEADLKSCGFIVKAVSATTVDVYALTDIDFTRGTDLTYQDADLKITASPLTIATSTAVEIPNTGLELTGGSGTIAMTTGDTAEFESRSINTGSTTVAVGGVGETIPTIGILCAAQKRGNNEIFYIDIPSASISGFPFNFTEKTWMESSIAFKASRDQTKGYVYRTRHIAGT